MLQPIAALQADIHRLIWIPRAADLHQSIARIQLLSGGRELLFGQARSGTFRDDWLGSSRPVKFVPIHQHASGQADAKDVQPDSDAAPQMDLKERSSQPDLLWLLNPALPSGEMVVSVQAYLPTMWPGALLFSSQMYSWTSSTGSR